MRNSILNEKMRIVDLGVAVCIDGILKGTEILLDETSSEAQKEQAKEQVKKYAGIYQQALADLVEALEPQQIAKRSIYQTACGIMDIETDEAMNELRIAIDQSKNFTLFYEAVQAYIISAAEANIAFETLAIINRFFQTNIEAKREELEAVLKAKEASND